jgi:hypothetical protein
MRSIRPVTLWSLIGVLGLVLTALTVLAVVEVRERLAPVAGTAIPASLSSEDSSPTRFGPPAGVAPVAPPRTDRGRGPSAPPSSNVGNEPASTPGAGATSDSTRSDSPASDAPASDSPDSTPPSTSDGAGHRDGTDTAPGGAGPSSVAPPRYPDRTDPGQPEDPSRAELRRRAADAFCDRYHLPRERCEEAASGS